MLDMLLNVVNYLNVPVIGIWYLMFEQIIVITEGLNLKYHSNFNMHNLQPYQNIKPL